MRMRHGHWLLAAFGGTAAAAARPAAPPSIIPRCQKTLSTPMQIIILMTLLTLLPAIHHVRCTPSLRISIVLHFLEAGDRERRPRRRIKVSLALSLFLTMVPDKAAEHADLQRGMAADGARDLTASEGNGTRAPNREDISGPFGARKRREAFLEITTRRLRRAGIWIDGGARLYAFGNAGGFQIGAIRFCLSCWWILWWRR